MSDIRSELLKKHNVTPNQGEGSGSSGNQTQDYRTMLLEKHSGDSTGQRTESVSNWVKEYNRVMNGLSRYRTELGDGYSSDMSGGYTEDIASLIAEFDNIKDYADRLGLPNAQRYVQQLKDLQESIKQSNNFMAQFKSEDAYKKWLQHSTPEKRKAKYEENAARLEELRRQKRESLTYQPGASAYLTGEIPYYSSPLGATHQGVQAASSTSDMDKEIARIEEEMRLYEYGETDETGFYYGYKTVDDYGKYLQDSEFLKASENRAFRNSDRAALSEYDAEQFRGQQAIAQGGYIGEDGNVYDVYGNLAQSNAEPPVQDKLGMFLSASDEDISEAYTILNAMQGSYPTTWASILQEGDTKRWKHLEEDELSIYYGLLNTEGQDAAYRYLDAMEVELGRREMQQVKAYIDETSGLEQIMLNVASVPLNMIGGIAATVDNATRLVTGKGLNPYSRAQSLLSTGNYIRSNTAQEINAATGNKEIPGLGFSFGDAYQAGMSMVDSLVGAKIGGKAYQAVMSMGAASSEMARLYSQGASTEQMVLGSVAAGAAEWVFEKYSIENLISMKSPDTLGQFLKNAFIQGGIEMSEEAATEVANILTNGLIMQSESDWAKALEANGGDYGKAVAEMAIQIANAGLSGLLSGMGSGSIQQGMQYGAQQQENKDIGSYISGANSTDALVSLAQEMAKGASGNAQKKLTAQSERLGEDFLTKGGKNNAVGRLYNTVQSVVTEQNIAEIAAGLQEKGFSEKDAKSIAGALVVQTNGIALTEKQQKVLDKFGDNADVKSVVSEILGNEDSGINQRNRSIANFEFGAMRNHIASRIEKELPRQENADASDNVDAKSEKGAESRYEVSAEGMTVDKSTGEIVNVQEVAEIKDGQMILRLDNGSTVNAEDVSFSSAGEALVYETVAQMGASVKAANILVNQFKAAEGMDAEAYAQGIKEAFRYGKLGIPASELSKATFASKLNAGQKDYVYRQGRKAAGKQVAKDQATVSQKAAVAKNATTTQKSRSYQATLEKGISVSSLSESQKASYRLADQIAEAAKVNIRVYAGKNGEHGYYDPKNDEIYLNLNAANKSRKSMMAFTLGHELVHRAKKGSPAKYQQFANFLMEQYGKQDSDIEDMIGEELAAAKRFHIEMSYEEAFEEVVCDACQGMLLDTDAGQKLAEFGAQSKQNRSFLDDLKRWITEFVEKLRSIFAGVEADSLAAKEFAEFDENVKKILTDMYVDMTIDAGENLSVKAVDTLANQTLAAQSTEEEKIYSLPKADSISYQEPAYQEWDVQAALYDAMDHKDMGDDNLIQIGNMPRYIVDKIGIEGDFYIYRNHAYENMVTAEQAKKDDRYSAKAHYHGLGIDKMTDAVMALENPIMTIATKTKDGNPAVITILPVEGKNKAPLYAVMSFYSDRKINGEYSRKPHIVLTIAEREFSGNNGRDGYAEIVGNAVKDGRVIDFDKKMRDSLSVIANQARVGDITEASLTANLSHFRKEIKSFREKNKIDYKLPVGEDTSPRALLANALESAAQDDKERGKIQEYKAQIDAINAQEEKLRDLNEQIKDMSFAKGKRDDAQKKKLRDLKDEAIKTANRINIMDKQLLRLEASQPLQKVLEREKTKAYQRAEKKGKEALEAYRKNAEAKQKQTIERYQESRKKAVENREKTAMRHKIQNVVGELNQLLLHGDKKRHVPESLKKAVADALALVNMDTVGAEERAAKYAALIAKETDPDKIDAYTVTMENILRQGEKMGQQIKELRDAYEEIQESDDPDIANAYDPVIAGCLQELSGSIGNTSLRDMSIEQLSDVYDMYHMVLTRVRDANKTLLDNIKESISKLASGVINEVRMTGGDHKYRAAILDPVRKFLWNNLKPVYAMEHIGSSTLTRVFDNVRAGEDTWAKDVSEAREYYLDKSRKYGYESWDFKKKHRFETEDGTAFELTLEQILSIYAYSKREQAHDHLRLGGFVFDSNIETYKETDGKTGKGIIKYKVNTADAHQITIEMLTDIIGTLTSEQMGFVDEMQDYLSTVMGAKGNEVTMKMYGVKLFKEKFYFPLKSAKQFMFEQNEVAGEVRIKNSGFTNKVVAKANNPVILSNFMDVWAGHVNDMSMYHGFVLPLEDFNRVFNFNSPKKEGQPSVSVKGTIQNAYSPAAVNYVKNMITDLNGGARTDSTTGVINKMMGLFKKGAVFASASVVVQQPSAIARATALVDTKYFIGPKVDHKRHKALWDEVKQYAPVAIIKEMGYFDTNMGKSTQDFILGKEYSGFKDKMKALVTDSNYRDEVLSKAPALADEIAWCGIWEAVKRETKAKHPSMDVKSEAFMKKAGERFTEVIAKTQVYDSVLSRSANMRSKDTGMKMATAFMAEPTTSINMIADALLQGKRGNRKYCRAAIGAVIASQILNAFLVSWVYAARDDDEEKSYAEKYIGSFTAEMLDGMNPLTYIPFIKDIVSIVQGYDVERSDMAVISDLWNAWKQLKSSNVSAWRKVEGFVGSICQIFGLPVKNIMRDVRGVWQAFDTIVNGENTTARGIGYAVKGAVTGKAVSNPNQLYESKLAGDAAHTARVEARYEDEDSANAAVRQAIKNDFLDGKIGVETAMDRMVEYTGMTNDEAYWLMDAWKYRKAMGTDDGYSKYSSFYDAVKTGKNLKAVIKEYTDNGLTEKDLADQITEEFKPLYTEMSAAERASIKGYLLNAFEQCGMLRMDAEKKLADWDFEAKHGFDYTNRGEAYRNREITREQLKSALLTYGGMTEAEAERYIDEQDFQVATGYAYSDKDDAYKEGYLDADILRTALMNIGGLSAEEADHQIEAYDWEDQNVAEAVTWQAVRDYYEYCAAVNVPKDSYLYIRSFSNNTENDVDEEGKTVYYSAMKKVMAEIHAQNLTAEQKTAIAKSLGWSDKNVRKYKLW